MSHFDASQPTGSRSENKIPLEVFTLGLVGFLTDLPKRPD